jgi:hypothetical protein
MNDVVLVDAVEQQTKFEDKRAKSYFAETKPPNVRVSKNVNVVSTAFEPLLKISND